MTIRNIETQRVFNNPQLSFQKTVQKPATSQKEQVSALNTLSFLGKVGSFISFKSHELGQISEALSYKLDLRNDKKVPQALIGELRSASSNQITGKANWNIEKPNVWMVTAETSTFMKTGGLGSVAVDLPESFNKQYNKDGCKMTIVQPLYESNGLVNLKDNNDGTYTYESKPLNNSIKLTATAEEVKVPTGKKGEVATVKVLKGMHEPTKTEYIFLQCEDYFGKLPNDGKKVTPYSINADGVGESERFAFFSKAVANYVKDLKEKDSADAPNIIDANDWHAGPLAAQFKYLMQAKAANGEISKELADDLKNIPIVYTVHNLEYQGWDYPNSSKILNLLYEGYAGDIFKNSYCPNMNESLTEWMKKSHLKPKSLIVRDTYNAGIHGLSLADAVVAVSPNYSKEIASKKFFGYDFVELLGARSDAGNLIGIVNGISPDSISPNGKAAKRVSAKFPELKEYHKGMAPEQIKSIRAEYKKNFIELIKSGQIEKRLNLTSTDAVKTANDKPTDVNLLANVDISKIEKTPLLTIVGRLEGQKGPDIMAKAIKAALTRPIPQGQEKPIVLILGTGEGAAELNKMKKELPAELSKRVVFYNAFSPELMQMIQTAGDMFVMPSKFEPCGLGQLEAMAKGNIPIATATGGLADTIEHGKTGFISLYDPDNLHSTQKHYNHILNKALDIYYTNRERFDQISLSALAKDFSWEESGSVAKYLSLFKSGTSNNAEVVSFEGKIKRKVS